MSIDTIIGGPEDSDGAQVHAQRTAGLTDAEKAIFNDGYLWASADSTKVFLDILDQEDLSAEDRLAVMDEVLMQASLPLMIAGMATGKNYI